MCDLLLTGAPSLDADAGLAAARATVQVTIPVLTLAGLDNDRPGKNLRRQLAARDQHCRWPGCRRAAARCEADHTIPWEHGGETSAANLELLCKGHHTLTHASPGQVNHLGGGTLEFVSPTRRRYRNNAPPTVTAPAARPGWARLLDARPDPGDPPPF